MKGCGCFITKMIVGLILLGIGLLVLRAIVGPTPTLWAASFLLINLIIGITVQFIIGITVSVIASRMDRNESIGSLGVIMSVVSAIGFIVSLIVGIGACVILFMHFSWPTTIGYIVVGGIFYSVINASNPEIEQPQYESHI